MKRNARISEKTYLGRSTEKEMKATVEVRPGTKVVSVNEENRDETERESHSGP